MARALSRYPHTESRIASLSIMGGTAGRSNTTSLAEFNAFNDPEALDALLASSISIHMVGYDQTSNVGLQDHHIAQLEATGRRAATFIGKVMKFYRSRQIAVTGLGIAPQHDACAVLPYVAPHLARYAEHRAAVELDGLHTRGMVVFDRRPTETQQTRPSLFADRRPIKLCVSLSADKIVDLILQCVLTYA